MKEFEKWDKEQHSDIACKRMDNISCNDCTDLKREGWRAALEMVHKYMIEQEPDAPYFDYVLLDKIEKELKE